MNIIELKYRMRSRYRLNFAADWDESQHPRGEHGRWVRIGGIDIHLDDNDIVDDGPSHLHGKTHDEAKQHMNTLMKWANIKQAELIGRYANKHGKPANEAAGEWIGKHAKRFRQEFTQKKVMEGGASPIHEDSYLWHAANEMFSAGYDIFASDSGMQFDSSDDDDQMELVWRTIGAVNHHGGRKVLINPIDGTIEEGGDDLVGKKVDELSKHDDDTDEPEQSDDIQERPEPNGHRRNLGDGGQPEHGDDCRGSDRGNGGPVQTEGRLVTARSELTKPGNPELVPEGVRQHLDTHQVDSAAKAIESMDKHGGFLDASGTGAGKTRTLLAVAKRYADNGKKVLIVTPNDVIKPNWDKGTVTGSFHNDSKAMGINLNLNEGEKEIEPGSIHLSTYHCLKELKDKVDNNTVLILDESHNFKNPTAAKTKLGLQMMKNADKVMYLTATPIDKAMHLNHLFRAGVFGGQSKERTLEKLGLVKDEWGTYRPQHGVTNAEVMRRISGLMDKMTEEGLMVRREISMKGVDIDVDQFKLPEQCHEDMRRIAENVAQRYAHLKPGLITALTLMQQRRQQEPYKVPHVVAGVQKELAEGRKCVIFLSRVNESSVLGAGEEADADDESAVTSEGTAKLLREALEKSGVPSDQIADIHGGVSKKQQQKSMERFQDGPAKVVIATVESGGTGINLDDTKGDAPRTLFQMTAPFSAVGLMQADGRIWRLKTKSYPRIKYLFGDTPVDDWNANLIAKKMRTLGGSVSGEVGKRDLPVPKGMEDAGTDEFKKPFAWHSLTEGLARQVRKPAIPGLHGPINPREVQTTRGRSFVHGFVTDDYINNLVKSSDKPKWLSAPRMFNGKLQASVWGDSPEQVADRVRQLQEKKITPEEKPPAPLAPEPEDENSRLAKHVTPNHKFDIHYGLKHLAGMDADRARERNNVGFNQMDSGFGGKLAEHPDLTPKMVVAGAKMLYKYRRQLPDHINESVRSLLAHAGEKPEPDSTKDTATSPEIDPVLRVKGNTFPHKEKLKAMGFRWDGDRKVWYRPRTGFDPSKLPSGLTHFSAEMFGADCYCVEDSPSPLMRLKAQMAAKRELAVV